MAKVIKEMEEFRAKSQEIPSTQVAKRRLCLLGVKNELPTSSVSSCHSSLSKVVQYITMNQMTLPTF